MPTQTPQKNKRLTLSQAARELGYSSTAALQDAMVAADIDPGQSRYSPSDLEKIASPDSVSVPQLDAVREYGEFSQEDRSPQRPVQPEISSAIVAQKLGVEMEVFEEILDSLNIPASSALTLAQAHLISEKAIGISKAKRQELLALLSDSQALLEEQQLQMQRAIGYFTQTSQNAARDDGRIQALTEQLGVTQEELAIAQQQLIKMASSAGESIGETQKKIEKARAYATPNVLLASSWTQNC